MRILLAIDDSEYSRAAIQKVAEQMRTKRTEIRLLNVIEPITSYISAEMIPHFVPFVSEVEEDRQNQAREFVKNVARELRKRGFKVSESVEAGEPKALIIDLAKEWGADLIVVGSHGWKGLNRFLLGSVSEAVMRHAECSVEIVRIPRGPKRPRRARR